MTVRTVRSFEALEVSLESVVIADQALPNRFLDALGDPIRVEAGEPLKRLERVGTLAERVLERRSTRPMTIVGVGGGSVGDAIGFLASILWRGVELRHVPTTLLAMVDSAHGGKTAVNLGDAKNQLGTFYPADEVLLVEEALATLPREQRRDGLAELVKGVWLGDPEAIAELEADGGTGSLAAAPFDAVRPRLMDLLERAIDVKREIVDRDPREREGIRTFLNFGHTVAHTLEIHTGISHGQAVLWGMLAASGLSVDRTGLDPAAADRLRSHLHPLLVPLARVRDFDDRSTFVDGVERDKKYVDGELRSVLLEAPGDPTVTRSVEPADWYRAFRRAVDWFTETPVHVERPEPFEAELSMATSKSEMNRALVIEHLRPGPTELDGVSEADDVDRLRRALSTLESTDGEATVDAGEGGTTFRFLCAVAADRNAPTAIRAAPALLDRPHEPLFRALERAGATVEAVEQGECECGGDVVRVDPWNERPETLRVSAADSSQYASALALLASDGRAFQLVIEGGADMPSRPYFEMTLAFLRRAGIDVTDVAAPEGDRALDLHPTSKLESSTSLELAPDESSRAVWQFGRLIGISEEAGRPPDEPLPGPSLQPDAYADELSRRLERRADDPDGEVAVDLSKSPDLGPAVTAVATQIAPAVRLRGASHLRHKESDRIGDLSRRLDAVGIDVSPTDDGLEIPSGVQHIDAGATWKPAGDHRLVMAGLLLTANGGAMAFEEPMVVAKSYPAFWEHARRLGWVTEVESTAPETKREQ